MAEFNNIKQLKTYSKKLERDAKKNENMNTLDSTKLQENRQTQITDQIPDESSMKQLGNEQASKVFAQFGQDEAVNKML